MSVNQNIEADAQFAFADPPLRVRDGSVILESPYDIVPDSTLSDAAQTGATADTKGARRPKKHKLKDLPADKHIRRVVIKGKGMPTQTIRFAEDSKCEIEFHWD